MLFDHFARDEIRGHAIVPVQQRAQIVDVAVINPRSQAHGAEPGADIALYLARHGIRVQVVQHHTGQEVGAALLALANEVNADLIVMGGYGHTRFREILLGGVTRTVLDAMTVPVLMSH